MKNLIPWIEILVAFAIPFIFIAFGVMLSIALFT